MYWNKKYYGRSWENYVKKMKFEDHILLKCNSSFLD